MITPEDRKAIMLRMREEKINNTAIGRVMGISRERVRQIIGNGSEGHRHIPPSVEEIVSLWESGEFSIPMLSRRLLVAQRTVEKMLVQHYGRKKFEKQARERKLKKTREEISLWLKRFPSRPITFSNVSSTVGQDVAIRWERVQPMAEWRKLFGQPVRLKKGMCKWNSSGGGSVFVDATQV